MSREDERDRKILLDAGLTPFRLQNCEQLINEYAVISVQALTQLIGHLSIAEHQVTKIVLMVLDMDTKELGIADARLSLMAEFWEQFEALFEGAAEASARVAALLRVYRVIRPGRARLIERGLM